MKYVHDQEKYKELTSDWADISHGIDKWSAVKGMRMNHESNNPHDNKTMRQHSQCMCHTHCNTLGTIVGAGTVQTPHICRTYIHGTSSWRGDGYILPRVLLQTMQPLTLLPLSFSPLPHLERQSTPKPASVPPFLSDRVQSLVFVGKITRCPSYSKSWKLKGWVEDSYSYRPMDEWRGGGWRREGEGNWRAIAPTCSGEDKLYCLPHEGMALKYAYLWRMWITC